MPRTKQEGVRGMTIAELEAKASLMNKIAAVVKDSGLYGRSRTRTSTKPEAAADTAAPSRRKPRRAKPKPEPPTQESAPAAAPVQERQGQDAPVSDPELLAAARNATDPGDNAAEAEPEKPARKPPQLAKQTLQRAPANPRPSMPHGTLPSDYDRS